MLNINVDKCSRCWILEFDLEYFKELYELRNDYTLAPDQQGRKKEMLFDYELNIADDYNISIGKVKKISIQHFQQRKVHILLQKLAIYLWQELKLKRYIAY